MSWPFSWIHGMEAGALGRFAGMKGAGLGWAGLWGGCSCYSPAVRRGRICALRVPVELLEMMISLRREQLPAPSRPALPSEGPRCPLGRGDKASTGGDGRGVSVPGTLGLALPFPCLFPAPAPGGCGGSADSCLEAAWPRFRDARAGGRLLSPLISQTNSLGHVPAPRGAAGPGWWLPDLIGSVCSADGWRGRGAGAFTCAGGSSQTCRDPGQHPDP